MLSGASWSVSCVVLLLPLVSPVRPSSGSFFYVYMFPWTHPLFTLFLFAKWNKNFLKILGFSNALLSSSVRLQRRVPQLGKPSGRGRFPHIGLGPSLRTGIGTLSYAILYLCPGLLLCSYARSFSAPQIIPDRRLLPGNLFFSIVPPKFPAGASRFSRAHLGSLTAWPEIFHITSNKSSELNFIFF